MKKMEWGMVIDEKAGLGLETAGNVKCGTTCGGAKSWLTLGGGGGSGQFTMPRDGSPRVSFIMYMFSLLI